MEKEGYMRDVSWGGRGFVYAHLKTGNIYSYLWKSTPKIWLAQLFILHNDTTTGCNRRGKGRETLIFFALYILEACDKGHNEGQIRRSSIGFFLLPFWQEHIHSIAGWGATVVSTICGKIVHFGLSITCHTCLLMRDFPETAENLHVLLLTL